MKMIKVNDSFEIGKYPVTQKQWFEVIGTKPSYFKGHPNRPVESVSWNDTQYFMTALNANTCKLGLFGGYRLPTEAEWLLAAGEVPSNLLDCGWFGDNSKARTHKVGEKLPNALGIYDMYGNVWEWLHDKVAIWHALRGGSWGLKADYARAAFRDNDTPAYRVNSYGFRVARSLL